MKFLTVKEIETVSGAYNLFALFKKPSAAVSTMATGEETYTKPPVITTDMVGENYGFGKNITTMKIGEE